MSVVRTALFALALLAGALSAGFFYTFSILVMPALGTADAGTAIVAMQKINQSVRTPLFAFAFFGAPALALLVAAAAGLAGHRRAAWLALVSGLLQVGAVFAVTMLVNVPLNEALAPVAASAPTAAATWAVTTRAGRRGTMSVRWVLPFRSSCCWPLSQATSWQLDEAVASQAIP